MALNKQVWLNTIVENFFPDNSFATKSIDESLPMRERGLKPLGGGFHRNGESRSPCGSVG